MRGLRYLIYHYLCFSSLLFTVNILPENDNIPKFEQHSYTFNISENIPGRFAIGAVRATDDDLDNLTYSLQPSTARGKGLALLEIKGRV